ncbi:hypothetical protein O3M35_009643 [Rhynocoris fuscipes]|uniref:Protein kinase domain-containing protein n=1 Tax=Rhynocoris fuscipes TaxID=488301 RepID=A0AAW1D608_9HEMI
MNKFERLDTFKKDIFVEVMKCEFKETSDIVIIKQYKKMEFFPEIKVMAIRELRLTRKLEHENILKLLRAFREKNDLYFIYEYVPCSLRELLNSESIPYHLKRGFSLQITRALAFLHRLNIVHGGLTPKNIMVTDNDVIKLRDFRFARYEKPKEFPTNNYCSYKWYKPPELLLPGCHYNSSADIWALGCIIMEMETSEPLFPGDNTYQQLSLITRLCGLLTEEQAELLNKEIMVQADAENIHAVEKLFKLKPLYSLIYTLNCKYPNCDKRAISFVSHCLKMNPDDRLPAVHLLNQNYFTDDNFRESYLQDLLIKANVDHKKQFILRNHMRRINTDKVEVLKEGPEKIIKFEVVEEKIVKSEEESCELVLFPKSKRKAIEEEEEKCKISLELPEEKDGVREEEENLSEEVIFKRRITEDEGEVFEEIVRVKEDKFRERSCTCYLDKRRNVTVQESGNEDEAKEEETEGLESTIQVEDTSELELNHEDFLWLFDDESELDKLIAEEKESYWKRQQLLKEEEMAPTKECPRCKYLKTLKAKRMQEKKESKPLPKRRKCRKCLRKRKPPSPEVKTPDVKTPEPCVEKIMVHYKRGMIPLPMTFYSGKKIMTEEEARNKECFMERIRKPGFDDICTPEMFKISQANQILQDQGSMDQPISRAKSLDIMDDYIRRGLDPKTEFIFPKESIKSVEDFRYDRQVKFGKC